jgi:hypothetical protein
MGTGEEQQVPPLAAGDQWMRADFWRWEAHREIKNAERGGAK